MKKFMLWVILSSWASWVVADDINQRTGLPPEAVVKVNAEIARAYIRGQSMPQADMTQVSRDAPGSTPEKSAGSVQSINNVNAGNLRQAPRNVITAARGDIINICFHCR